MARNTPTIGIDISAALNQRAGIGRFVRNLTSAVVAGSPDIRYVLLHARPDGDVGDLPNASNVRTVVAPLRQRLLDIVWHRARLPVPVDLLTGRLDVFHAPNFVLPPVRAARTVLTIHDLAYLLHPECAHPNLRAYLGRAVPYSAKRADYIVADSENTRSDVISMLGVDPDRIGVVPGGVEPRFAPIADPAALGRARTAVGLDDSTPFILFVGTIEPRKNLTALIQAFNNMKARTGLPHRLVLAGRRGWLADDIYAAATRSRWSAHITFPSFVADDDLSGLYSAAEIFAYPSLYEGFGLPVLEAMACGTPVVCSNTSSLPEAAGDAAVLVSPHDVDGLSDALAALTSDTALRARHRGLGLAQAARFTWQSAAEAQIAVYRQLLAER
ncbi:MAG: glycosyltransferase family 1 protein [Chloroflexota bacterium]